MKKNFVVWVFLVLSVGVGASGKTPVPEAEQQARLISFNPIKPAPLSPQLSDQELLLEIARVTWIYFRDLVDKENGLPIDNVYLSGVQSRVGSFTSTTNIGLYLMSLVSAEELGFLSSLEAEDRVKRVLNTLEKLPHWEGQLYNYYETITLEPSRKFVSSVDNGWLAAGFIVARQSFPALSGRIDPMLNAMNFAKLYDPEVGQFYLGYDIEQGQWTTSHYGLLCTEPRLASYLAIAKGDLPREHWYLIFRTLPLDRTWQTQVPQGVNRKMGNSDVFYGYYQKEKIKFVPSWGGSLFEFLMPTLVLDEQSLSPRGLGANNSVAVNEQIHYAIKEKKYPLWGISPCSIPDQMQGYREYGVPYLGTKGYPDEGVITPHVAFLALMVTPKAALANIQQMAAIPGLFGPYGFYDSLNVRSGKISKSYLALDQGMTLISLANYLKEGIIQKRFLSYPPMAGELDLLRNEVFFQ